LRGAWATKQSLDQFRYKEIASLRSHRPMYSMLHALCSLLLNTDVLGVKDGLVGT